MNINDKSLDDLDSLIESIGEKKGGDTGDTGTPKTPDLSNEPYEPETTGSPELPEESNEPLYEPLKPSVEPAPPSPKYTPEIDMEPDMRYSPMRPSSGSPNRVIWLVALFIVVLIFFFILRLCAPKPAQITETTDEKTTVDTQETGTGTGTDEVQTTDQGATNLKAQPVYELSEETLQGAAPLTVKPNGPVVSAAIDPEIAAAADALKIRVKIIGGSSTKTVAGIATTISSGTFLGFKVNHTLQQKNGEDLRDEITVITPSRGVITVKGNILDAMKKIDYKTFLAELKTAGLEVIKNELPGEGIMNVQLRMTGSLSRAVGPDLLIGPRSVGPVELGMPIKKLESILANSYEVVAKRIADEEIYYDTFKVLDAQNQPLFFVIGSAGKVMGIQVVSPKFKTSRGIGLGNKLGEFRICYLKNGKITVSSTPVGIPFASTSGIVASFFLQGQGLDFGGQVFPDDLRISDILVGKSPFVK